MGICGFAFLIMLVLKLVGIITFGWFVVFLPLIIEAVVDIIAMLIIIFIAHRALK